MEKTIDNKNYHFIINPITAQAHFKRDRSETPLRTRSRPRLSCEVIVDEIHLSLSDVSFIFVEFYSSKVYISYLYIRYRLIFIF